MAKLTSFYLIFYTADGTLVYNTTHLSPPATSLRLVDFNGSVAAQGGFKAATILLRSESTAVVEQVPIHPGYMVELLCQEVGGITPTHRWRGVVESVSRPKGTDPWGVTIKAVGVSAHLKQFPVFKFLDDSTPQMVLEALVPHIAAHSLLASDITDIDASSNYVMARFDSWDEWATDCFRYIAKLIGGANWGVGLYDKFWFTDDLTTVQGGATYLQVGVNLKTAVGSLSNTEEINGYLLTHQRKLLGSDLHMFVPPTGNYWRIAKRSVPAAVNCANLWQYGEQLKALTEGTEEAWTLETIGLAHDMFPGGIIKGLQRVYTESGTGQPSHVDLRLDGYSIHLDSKGDLNYKLRIGKHPDTTLGNALGHLLAEVEASRISAVVAAHELASAASDIIREHRRNAAKDWGMRNFWGTMLTTLDSVVDADTVALHVDGIQEVPDQMGVINFPDFAAEYPTNSDYDNLTRSWRYLNDNRISSNRPGSMVLSKNIPTGRKAVYACVQINYATGRVFMNPSKVSIHKAEWDNAGVVQTSSPDIYAQADGICPWHTGYTDARNYYIYNLDGWKTRVSQSDWATQDCLNYIIRIPKERSPSTYRPTDNGAFVTGWANAMFIDLYAGYNEMSGTNRWGHLVRMCFPKDTTSAYWTFLKMINTDPDEFRTWAGATSGPWDFAVPEDETYLRVKIGFPYETLPQFMQIQIQKMDGTPLSGAYIGEFAGTIPEPIGQYAAVGWWRLPPFGSPASGNSRHPDSYPKWRATEFSGDPLAVAVSRDGENWAYGASGDQLSLSDQNGAEVDKNSIRIATVTNIMRPISGWSVGFKHTDEG